MAWVRGSSYKNNLAWINGCWSEMFGAEVWLTSNCSLLMSLVFLWASKDKIAGLATVQIEVSLTMIFSFFWCKLGSAELHWFWTPCL